MPDLSASPTQPGHADAPEAALALGQMLLDGGKPQDALESFAMAARGGSAAALTMIGRIHERGWGVRRDPALAARYFTRAAGAGDAWAMFNLADLHLSGEGVARDPARAHALYVDAASRGQAGALNMLGMLAESGLGPDPAAAAAEYFRAGAQAGDPWARFNLARLLLDRGDRDAALDWLDRAIAAGFPAFWRGIAGQLAAHPDPGVRDRATEARRRAAG